MRSEFFVWKEIIAVRALSKLSLTCLKVEDNSASSSRSWNKGERAVVTTTEKKEEAITPPADSIKEVKPESKKKE